MGSRIVLIADSDTGALVDVAGQSRESGRYLRFARRMMSLAKNPGLDYGVNGGDTLTISKNGSAGKAINLVAETVNVTGSLKVGERTVEEMVGAGVAASLERVVGTDGQVAVATEIDGETGGKVRRVSLDPSIVSSVEDLSDLVARIEALEADSATRDEVVASLVDGISILIERIEALEADSVTRVEVASLADGISILPEDTFDSVKEKMSELLDRISALSAGSSGASSDSPEE